LETAVELLDVVSIDQLTITMVLERSGVSSGSLYHFYADISDLVEQAVVHRYTRRLKESLTGVRDLLDARDRDDFRDRAERLIRRSLTPETRVNRLDRVEALGAMQGRPRLGERIAHAQREITDAQAEMFIEFQHRGWLRADLDAVALSGFTQAVLLGQIVNDIAERPVHQETWIDVTLRALSAVLFPD
jgi:AcrR family transcriptional regulator